MADGIFRFLRETKAITAIEYGLLAALVAMAVVAAVGLLGNDLGAIFSTVANSL